LRLSNEFIRQAHRRGEAFPVAISIGIASAITAVSIVALPPDTDELGLAGAFRNEAADLIKCETIPLEVPPKAEIIIEGEIRPGDIGQRGPLGNTQVIMEKKCPDL
jgi:4-hydroxy-3-polyprenylbenzoate decarboxylase